MSQLLAFAFKRRRPMSDGDQCVPGVIASQNSTDTNATTVSSSTEWTENYICIPRKKGVTVTPEGLLPRKPLVELRADLLPHEELRLVATTAVSPRDTSPVENLQENVLKPNQQLVVSTFQNNNNTYSKLLPARPSRSWSTRSSSYRWGSPSTATGTNNGTPSTNWTAESPNLIPGQARTAVGNLVALQQHATTVDPPGVTPVLLQQQQRDPWSPSPPYYRNDAEEEEQRVESMFSPLSNVHRPLRIGRDPSAGGSSKQKQQRQSTSVLFSPVLSEKSSKQNIVVDTSSPAASSRKLTICERQNTSSGETTIRRHVSHVSLDQDMKRIKARNQHQAKEELCLQVLERLQDNIELVTKIDGMFPWFGGSNNNAFTSPDDEDKTPGGFITGFPEEMRYRISDKLDLLLYELNSGVQTEEFFFSPGKADMSEYSHDHQELRKAVGFCKVLVQMAIPPEENETESIQGTIEVGQWRFLFREEIGLDIPQTPHKTNSSNSSFFSLPENEAATPMTSNVSLGASTLTSRPQVLAGMPAAPPQNGLDMRHALQSFIAAVGAMGDACHQFAATSTPDGLVRTAEQIKQTYAMLMHETLDVLDLKFLVDAFEFVVDESTEIESPVMRAATLGSGRMMNLTLDDASNNTSKGETSFELMEEDLRVVGSIDYGDDDDDDDADEEESRDTFPGWDDTNSHRQR